MNSSLNESLTQWNHRDDPCTTGTETETFIQYSFALSCELTGQSAPLLMEKIFHMSSEAQRVSYDIKSIILKTQPIIRDMKWSTHTKTHSNEKFPFKPQFLSSTSCVWFQGQCGFTERYYRAKNSCLPFLVCVATVIERAQGKDLLSLSKAKEKTNINHSSPLGPATPNPWGTSTKMA